MRLAAGVVFGTATWLVGAGAAGSAPPLAPDEVPEWRAQALGSVVVRGTALVALGFLDDSHLVALGPRGASLVRIDAPRLVEVAREPVPAAKTPTRAPAGIVASLEAGAAWVHVSGATEAVLLALDGRRLVTRARATSIPWPGLPQGLAFRDGTNEIRPAGSRPEVQDGVGYLALARHAGHTLAVERSGRLVRLEDPPTPLGRRVGGCLASLDATRIAASAPSLPGHDETVLVLEVGRDSARVLGSLPVPGAVCALAARRLGQRTWLATALEARPDTRVVVWEVRESPPVQP